MMLGKGGCQLQYEQVWDRVDGDPKCDVVQVESHRYNQTAYLPPLDDVSIFCDIGWHVLQVAAHFSRPPFFIIIP